MSSLQVHASQKTMPLKSLHVNTAGRDHNKAKAGPPDVSKAVDNKGTAVDEVSGPPAIIVDEEDSSTTERPAKYELTRLNNVNLFEDFACPEGQLGSVGVVKIEKGTKRISPPFDGGRKVLMRYTFK